MNTEIPVVIAFTPNYFVPAATCLYSILKHSRDGESFRFICLSSEELPEQMKRKIKLVGNGRGRYSFINMRGKLHGIYINPKYTEAASYRLVLPDLLPQYEKVIYIDCDIIVRNDLADLYRSTNLGNNYLAAVFEAPLDFQVSRLNIMGYNPREYANSGLLLMNLSLMRQDGIVDKFMKALQVDYLEFPDQDVLNQVCRGKIIGLPPFHNSIRTFHLPQYKPFFLQQYTEQDWKEVQQHGNVHYTGSKPWNSFTVAFKLWWTYYEELPQTIQGEWSKNRIIYGLYRFCKTRAGWLLLASVQNIYRKIRYSLCLF